MPSIWNTLKAIALVYLVVGILLGIPILLIHYDEYHQFDVPSSSIE